MALQQCFIKKKKIHLLLHMQNLFVACLKDEKLPPTWSQAKLVMLPKVDRDLTFPQSYRPISLLNVTINS